VILGFIRSRRYASRAGKSSKPKTPLEGVRLNQALEGVRLQVKSEEVGAIPKMRSGPSNTKSL